MKCQKCKGKVWVETDRPEQRYYDFVCVNCGWRKIVDTSNDSFGAYIKEKVLGTLGVQYFWVDRPNHRTLLARGRKGWRVVLDVNISDERQAIQA